MMHGGDIYRNPGLIDFSANINPLGMPDSVAEAACKGVYQSVHYPDVLCQELICELSVHEQVKQEHLICSNGAAELMYSLVLAKKPGKALVLAPTFLEYEQALKTVNCEILCYHLKKERDYQLDEEYLNQLSKEIDMIFLCNPNNPTGSIIEPDLMKRILKKAQEKQILVVIDECFLDFLPDADKISMKPMISSMDHVFIIKAFTKLYAMPGLRLGYGMCSNTKLLDKVKGVTQAWNVSTPAQLAGAVALKEKSFVQKSIRLIEEENQWLKKELSALGLKIYPSRVNYILFELSDRTLDLYQYMHNLGFLIRDCSNYRNLTHGFYRIAVKTHEDNQKLIQALKCVLS